MHFIIGFAILVAVFALFPRVALLFTLLGVGGGAILLLISWAMQQKW